MLGKQRKDKTDLILNPIHFYVLLIYTHKKILSSQQQRPKAMLKIQTIDVVKQLQPEIMARNYQF